MEKITQVFANMVAKENGAKRFTLLVALLLVGVVFRLIPLPSNFSPMIAIALFAGAVFNNKSLGAVLPIIIMALSDLVLGFHGLLLFVYGAMAGISVFGAWSMKKWGVKSWLAGSLGGSLAFFLVTNFGVWLTSVTYAKTFHGLITCYIAGLPFMQNTIISTLAFSFVIFNVWHLVNAKVLKPTQSGL